MAFHDYYKLLNIPKNSKAEAIKRAYREIAKKLHPDTNPQEKGAEEFFKIVTEGYNTLSNPQAKAEYDRQLQYAYNLDKGIIKPSVNHNNHEERDLEKVRQRMMLIAQKQRREAYNLFVNRENILSHKLRYTLLVLAFLSGYFVSFNRWFVDEASMDYLVILLGLLSMVLTSYFLTNHIFIHLKTKNMLFRKSFIAFEKISVGLFVFLFFMGPISIPIINNVKKSYHMKHYAVYVKPEKITLLSDKILYSYTANQKIISKSIADYDQNEAAFLISSKIAVVKVSKHNPKISKLIFMDQHPVYHN